MTETVDGYTGLVDIGGGGFSRVYRAFDSRHNRVVALKVLETRGASDSERRAFDRELKAMGGVKHQHVVSVFASGETDSGKSYLAMDLYELGTFADAINRDGPLPVSDVLDLGIKIASALETAHRGDVIHRDVKPDNIFVGEFGMHALADFGISSISTGDFGTRTQGVALTPAHAAPEVWEDEKPTAAADLYSLGSTLYNLLAGAPPFVADSHPALLRKVLSEDPPQLRRDDIPFKLRQLLKKMLAKEAGDRPGSALEVAQALSAIQAAEGFAPTPVTVKGVDGSSVQGPRNRASSQTLTDRTIVRDDNRTTVPGELVAIATPVPKKDDHPNPQPLRHSEPQPKTFSRPPADETELRSSIQKPIRHDTDEKANGEPPLQLPKPESGSSKPVLIVALLLILAAVGLAVLSGRDRGSEDIANDPADAAVQQVDPEDIGPVILPEDPTNLVLRETTDGIAAEWEGATGPNITYEVREAGASESVETDETALILSDLPNPRANCVEVRVTTAAPSRVGDWVGPACTSFTR